MEPPLRALGQEGSTYHQVDAGGRILLWSKTGGEWVLQANIQTGFGLPGPVLTASVVLNNEEIKGLPSTPVVIVPATEVLNYSGFPTRLFVPVKAYVVLDTTGGAYSNTNGNNNYLVLAWGSDWSLTLARGGSLQEIAATSPPEFNFISSVIGSADQAKQYISFAIGEQAAKTDNLQDNAIAITMNNGGAGPLQDGHSDNTMLVVIQYFELSLN